MRGAHGESTSSTHATLVPFRHEVQVLVQSQPSKSGPRWQLGQAFGSGTAMATRFTPFVSLLAW